MSETRNPIKGDINGVCLRCIKEDGEWEGLGETLNLSKNSVRERVVATGLARDIARAMGSRARLCHNKLALRNDSGLGLSQLAQPIGERRGEAPTGAEPLIPLLVNINPC
ncbi:uncharacterized protein BDR25DRAFT_319638 [Lindgomyces ingoldianus]|uniref:Uncharacterized protein n=1 Tax=Lindgomyces ingoldianus TaxID=673940 RepID=A0ACB6QCN3_9PLEO|nr:uncharacterized protein BDR25DRAFT_319638 [Lindgomyces ingoldianus]KAF2463910.1 hypothetical protein BDR25DRAFT_319638 [Lindgomyces ingoldianus]